MLPSSVKNKELQNLCSRTTNPVWFHFTPSPHTVNSCMLPLLTTLPPPSALSLSPPDINLAGEPKPHRSKTVKRSAGDMYRCARLYSDVSNPTHSRSMTSCILLSLISTSALSTVHRLISTTTFRETTTIGTIILSVCHQIVLTAVE